MSLASLVFSLATLGEQVSAKAVLGEFEHHVLLAALRLADGAYSASIVLELEERIGREVAPAAVYIALRRLEDNALVRSEMRESDGRGGHRERRHFEVTEEGLEMLRESRRRFERLWEGLEPVAVEGSDR